MYISHKSNVIQHISDTEWDCRRMSKGLSKAEYWAWEKTITDEDGIITYPSEDFTIVDCRDEDILTRLEQLHEYVKDSLVEGKTYNIKWSDDKKDGSHLTGDDSKKEAHLLAEEWKQIRAERDRLLTETDWMSFSDSPTMSAANKTYRQKLRDLPEDQKDKKTFADITWPTKPS